MFIALPLDAVLLDTFIDHLALLFLNAAGPDFAAARRAASRMVAVYHPADEEELSLVASIISQTMQSLQAAGEAADPTLPAKRVAELRSTAVRMSKEAHRNRRALILYRRDRQKAQEAATETAPQATEPGGAATQAESDPEPIASPPAAAKRREKTWTENFVDYMLAGGLIPQEVLTATGSLDAGPRPPVPQAAA